MFDKLIELVRTCGQWLIPFVVIQQYERGIVMRLGRPHRDLEPGFHWLIPLGLEHALTHSIVPSVHHLAPQSLSTKDGQACVCQVVVTWQVHNIRKLLLQVESAETALRDSVLGVIAGHVAQLDWLSLVQENALDSARKDIRARAFRWGIEVLQVSFSDVQRCKSLRLWQDNSPRASLES